MNDDGDAAAPSNTPTTFDHAFLDVAVGLVLGIAPQARDAASSSDRMRTGLAPACPDTRD